MREFTERAFALIQAIPPGKVMSYGQIAAAAGSPRGARQVVRILHSLSTKHGLPWHRVINSQGKIGFRDPYYREVQIRELEAEGVTVTSAGNVDLELYQYDPEHDGAPA
jgi:methylated-DNA-protein-cysteine methyltransferase-like protein